MASASGKAAPSPRRRGRGCRLILHRYPICKIWNRSERFKMTDLILQSEIAETLNRFERTACAPWDQPTHFLSAFWGTSKPDPPCRSPPPCPAYLPSPLRAEARRAMREPCVRLGLYPTLRRVADSPACRERDKGMTGAGGPGRPIDYEFELENNSVNGQF